MKYKTEVMASERKDQHEVVQSSTAFPENQNNSESTGSLFRNQGLNPFPKAVKVRCLAGIPARHFSFYPFAPVLSMPLLLSIISY